MPESQVQSISIAARRYTLGVLVVVYTFNFIDRQILAILLPAIRVEFGVDDWVLGFLAGSAFALFYATLGIPIALLGDRWNRRNLIAIAVAIWSAMTALSGAAANIVHLALARIGVGIGEAGCSPPAHSMISDLYPPEQRSTAMGIFTLGISIGIMLAYLAGGWVVQNIGWREAFFMVGLPGLLLALVVRFTLPEPQRGMSDGRIDSGQNVGILGVSRFLLDRRSFIHLALGAGLASFNGYAVISFFPSFMARSHGMSIAEIGVYLGLIIGIAGGLGFAGGGYLADKASRWGTKYSLWTVSAATMFGWLFIYPMYTLDNPYWVLMLLITPTAFSNFYLATTFAQVQAMVGLRMRAMASALLLFLLNIIGLGLGPQITGILSDAFRQFVADDSLRYSLLIVGLITGPWSAFHYFRAGQTIDEDIARADEPVTAPTFSE
jgi:predicted MFS family arabinose efflux permease